jgi:hypothetical protein
MLTALLSLFPFVFLAVTFVATYLFGYQRGVEAERADATVWQMPTAVRERILAQQHTALDDLLGEVTSAKENR